MTLGENVYRVDAVAKVTGAALYPGDLTRPDLAHPAMPFVAGKVNERSGFLAEAQEEVG